MLSGESARAHRRAPGDTTICQSTDTVFSLNVCPTPEHAFLNDITRLVIVFALAFVLFVFLALSLSTAHGAANSSCLTQSTHHTLCVGSVSESKFEGRRLGRLSFEPAR